MYAVNGFPSTRTSTRRWASCGTTSTRGLGARGSGFGSPESRVPSPKPPRANSSQVFRIFSVPSTHHHVALGVVEHHLPPAVHRRDRHAQRDRVAVAPIDTRVGLLAAAPALHPVPDVGVGGRMS